MTVPAAGGSLRALLRIASAGLVPCIVLASLAIAGIDFGTYWDDHAMIAKVQRALAPPPTLLPFAYDYPGVPFLIALSAVTPEAFRDPAMWHNIPDTSALRAFVLSDQFRLRLRTVFAVVGSLAALWTAAISLALGAPLWEALLAAALLATSWEVNYHLRWIAPDGAMMQFAAAAVAAALSALGNSSLARQRARTLLTIAAVAAGLATASKYSAWPITIPVMLAGFMREQGESTWARLTTVVRLGFIAVVTFFVVSPGTILQPTLAISQIRWQSLHYGTLGHGIYTVQPGIDHASRLMTYVGAALLSPYWPIAAFSTVLAAYGAWSTWRESPRNAACLLAFPIFYAVYMSMQRAMIVRNLLVLAPFMAVLAARGLREAFTQLGHTRWPLPARVLLATSGTVALAFNLVFAVSAVGSIRHRQADLATAQFQSWLATQAPGSVRVVGRLAMTVPTGDPLAADARLAMEADGAVHSGLRANNFRAFAHVFGPREVNVNYYPDWPGELHIVVLTPDRARRLGVANP